MKSTHTTLNAHTPSIVIMVVTSTCPCALREPDRSSINAKIKYAGDITLITLTPSLITSVSEVKSSAYTVRTSAPAC